MADLFLAYVPPTGTVTHKLRARQLGTDSGTPAIAEYVEEAVFGVDVAAGQVTVATSEAALPSVAGRKVSLVAHPDNGDPIVLGPTGVTITTGYLLLPGARLELRLANLNLVHAVAAAAGNVLGYLVETAA